MQAFSNTVRDIYALAEYASPDQFLHRAIELLQNWIRFDGVLFGTGESPVQTTGMPAMPASNSSSDTLNTHQQAQSSKRPQTKSRAKSHASSFQEDPVAQGFRNAPHSPLRGGIREIYRKGKAGSDQAKTKTQSKGRRVTGVRSLAEELSLCHLLVHGDNPEQSKPARWIVLYRAQDVRFSQTDAACLHSLWTHLSRAMVINRMRTVERQQKKTETSVSGLISMDGTIDIADARFFDMLESEWPELAPDSMPQIALEYLQQGKVFRGKQIEISMVTQHGFNVCRIRSVHAQETLTPREFVVARRFAAGMSHKQIARELGVSHHTIRNQLAHLYRKLNLHDKEELAEYLATNVMLN